MKKSVFVYTVLLLILIPGIAYGYDSISIENNLPDQTDCDKIPSGLYEEFKNAVRTVLESGVMSDIDSQIESRTNTDMKVTVQIFLVNESEFIEEYARDNDQLPPERTREELRREAEDIYGENDAYTYITNNVRNGVQVVKIKFFCRDSLRMDIIDNRESTGYDLYELIIHELVHAKLYSIYLLYGEEPFQDHDDNFFREIGRLKQKLLEEIRSEESDEKTFNLDEMVKKYNANSNKAPWMVKKMLGNERIDVHIVNEEGEKTPEPDFNLIMSDGKIRDYSTGPSERPTVKLFITEDNFRDLMESQNPGKAFVTMYGNGDIVTEEISIKAKIKFAVGRILMKIV